MQKGKIWRRAFRLIGFFLIFSPIINDCFATSVRICTYNILNFPEAIGLQRIDDFRIVVDYINPDILVVQEMQSQVGVNLFLDSVMNYNNNQFSAAAFHDGPDTDNSLFYRTEKVEYLSCQYLSTQHRDIAEYKFITNESKREFYIYSVHFKSSQGATNEAIRLEEATRLRGRLDSLGGDANFLVAGDYNIYYSDEPAFHKLTDNLTNGRLYDPLNAFGNWHENENFSATHSQSTRVKQLPDGGAGGGLDDRFDIILCSKSLLNTTELYLVGGSYTICGNDGEHFDVAINSGFNQAVPPDVANALYYASDHLPVFVDMSDGIEEVSKEIVQIWPNPMKMSAQIRLPWYEDFQEAKLIITNILGQRIYAAETRSPNGFELRREKLPIGIYFVHIEIETKYNKHKFDSKLAVIE